MIALILLRVPANLVGLTINVKTHQAAVQGVVQITDVLQDIAVLVKTQKGL